MTYSEAAHILGIQGYISPKMTKNAYLKLAKRYHPDKDSKGLEMMKKINNAFATLENYTGRIEGINNLTTYRSSKVTGGKQEAPHKFKNMTKNNLVFLVSLAIILLYVIFGIIYGCAYIKSLHPIVYNYISGLLMMTAIAYVAIYKGNITLVAAAFFGSSLFLIIVELTRQYLLTS